MTESYSDKIHEAFEARVNDLAIQGDLAESGRQEQRQRSQRLLDEDEFSPDDRPKSRPTNTEILSRNFHEGFIKPPELTTVDGDDDEADDDYDIVYRGAYSESESESGSESEEDQEGGSNVDEEEEEEEEEEEDFFDPEKQLQAILRAENAEGEDEASEALSIQRSRAQRLNEPGFESFFMSSVVGEDASASSASFSETQAPPSAAAAAATDEDRARLMVQSHPEVPTLLSELKLNLANVSEDLIPILRKTRKIKFLSDGGRSLIQEKFRASQLSSIGILYYLALVASGGDAKNHPVVRRLVEARSRLESVTEAEERADISISRLRELFSSSEPLLRMRKKPKKKIPAVRERRVRFDLPQSERGSLDEEDENLDEEDLNLGDFSSFRDILGELDGRLDEDGVTGKKRPRPDQFDVNPRRRKRAKVSQRIQEDQEFFESSERAQPSHEIVKSKGLREKGRGFLHPRIKHRARYYFKTKKLRELNRRFDNEKGGNYAGEEGIESRTVKSRRIRK